MEDNDNQIVEDWKEQVKILTEAGFLDNQARAIISLFASNGWLLIRCEKYPKT